MRRRFFRFLLTIPLLLWPLTAMADLNGAPTLTTGQSLSLDTGAVSTSGGDILWNGAVLQFQGSATGSNFSLLGITGNLGYDFIEESGSSSLSDLQTFFTGGLLDPTSSGVGSVIGLQTNGGNYAVILITANSGSAITLQYVTFGAAAPAGPFITQVINNYSLIPAGLPNSGIAPGSLFIIKGSGLASATSVSAPQSSATGLPTTLNGASVSVTDSHGVSGSPAFYYAIGSQLALVLPSNMASGLATLTVTYNGQTSPPYTVPIVTSLPGFASYYGTGQGLGIATDPVTGALFSYSNPIPPGASVVLWGSGLGADPARDTTFVPGAFAINNLAQIYVGGVPAVIQYQGASGYPGVNQINIQIPQNAPTGCFISVTGVTALGIPTNAVVLPIANGACNEPALALNSSSLTQLSGQQNVNSAVLEINYVTEPNPDGTATQTLTTATAAFQTVAGANYGNSDGTVSIGGCILNKFVNSTPGSSTATALPGLSGGAITLTPPSLFNRPVTLLRDTLSPGLYSSTLPAGFLTTSGGAFTFTGTAGSQVGAFTAEVTFSNPLLTWTNQSAAATVSRSASMPITWAGGDPGTIVTILGTAFGAGSTAQFLCAADAAAGQFTIPSWVLAAFPAGEGYLTVQNQTLFNTFSATGTDRAYARGLVVDEILTQYE
jgi:uncharacterized protein (TIGR03437 family)